MTPVRIFSADLLVADLIISPEANPDLARLVVKYGLEPGGKMALTHAQFNEFSAAIEGYPVVVMPGGSSANMLATLGALLGDEVEIRFMGVGGGGYGDMIVKSLKDAGIALLPAALPTDPEPQAAVSLVIVFPGGQRSIATWPGNAKAILKPAMIPPDAAESDILLVQGSLWHKLDPHFVNCLLEMCRSSGSELWLTLPTQPVFAAEDAAHFQRLIPHAALILGNEEELARIWCAPPQNSVAELQRALGKRQTAFITCGSEGVVLITAGGIERIPPVPVAPHDIINTLGAGDTAFAGFAAGYLRALPQVLSARIAMALSSEKLKINAARLSDAKASLIKSMPGFSF